MKTLSAIQQTISLGFIGSTILLTPVASQALTVQDVTNPQQTNDGWVTDMADILSDTTEVELNRLINDLEQTNGTEIAVVTVPETAPVESPKAFATELFNHWGIGKADVDNGILFLVSMGDKRVEIETGYGIENILTDAEVAQIINTKITPQYKQGHYDRGTLEGTEALILSLQPSANVQTSSLATILLIILVIWCIFSVASNISSDTNTSKSSNNKKRKRSRSSSQNYYTDCNSNSSSSNGGFFSSGSSCSDGGGFGGGSSDGGGAGGDF